ncbi:MAG: hypothetical protein GY835_14155 [bacterium]|nr:hypothetical protein [bacterium]
MSTSGKGLETVMSVDVFPAELAPGELLTNPGGRVSWAAHDIRIKLYFPGFEEIFSQNMTLDANCSGPHSGEEPGDAFFIIEIGGTLNLAIRDDVEPTESRYIAFKESEGIWRQVNISTGVDPVIIIGHRKQKDDDMHIAEN